MTYFHVLCFPTNVGTFIPKNEHRMEYHSSIPNAISTLGAWQLVEREAAEKRT